MNNYTYISDISIQELREAVVISCRTDDGKQCILIKNAFAKTISSDLCTDSLVVTLNRIMESNGETFYFHSIESKKIDGFSEKQFDVMFEYIFKKIQSPIEDTRLYSLIKSLEDYFQTTAAPDKFQLQIGVFGELLFVEYLHDTIYPDITNKYHKNFFSKHDIEISPALRIEIKTSLGQKRIHHFKHDQLVRNDVSVYVGSLLLEESSQGLSLYELFQEIMQLIIDPDDVLALERLMVRCSVDERDQGIRISKEKAMNEIRIISNKNLPSLPIEVPNGISSVEYDVDCSFAEEVLLNDFITDLYK